MRSLPGTQAAAAAECAQLSGGIGYRSFSRSDRPLPEPFHRGDSITLCGVGPDYFKASGTPLVRGRFITDQDFAHPGTFVLINEAAARAYFPGEDPVGKQIGGGRQSAWKIVVDVISDTKNQGLNQPPMPAMFVDDPGSNPLFVVRNIGDTQALISAVRKTASYRLGRLREI